MIYVTKQQGQSDDKLIRDFSSKVRESGVIDDVKRRKFHLKPSLAKKLKKKIRQAERSRIRLV